MIIGHDSPFCEAGSELAALLNTILLLHPLRDDKGTGLSSAPERAVIFSFLATRA